jgi:hypothetical protein
MKITILLNSCGALNLSRKEIYKYTVPEKFSAKKRVMDHKSFMKE